MIDLATRLVASGGHAGVFLLMLLENLFPPIPSEVIMPLAGFGAAQGRLSLVGVIVAGTLGALAGNAVWFELARWFGAVRARALLARFGGRFGVGPAEIARGEAVLRRHGAWAVFLGRFMPGIRTAISVPAGLIELPRLLFYGWTALGTLLWTAGLAIGGYVLEDDFTRVEAWAGPVGLVALALGGLLIAWLLWRAWRRAR